MPVVKNACSQFMPGGKIVTETVITVRGEFSHRYPAERAILSASVSFDGEDREAIITETADTASTVREHLAELKHDGAITSWSSDRVQIWAERPWNQDGQQLDPVTHASIGFRLVFTDFDELGRFLSDFSSTAGIAFQQIEWELTDATRTTATAEVRSRAVKDAVSKATVFAQSIGLGSVRATALADPGMLGDQAASSGSPTTFAIDARMAKSSGDPQLSVNPEDIEVTALVDARFLAT